MLHSKSHRVYLNQAHLLAPRYIAKAQLKNFTPHNLDELSDLIMAGYMKRDWGIFDTFPFHDNLLFFWSWIHQL